MEDKGIFTRIPLDLYKRLEKIRIEKNVRQKTFFEDMILKYVEKEEAKKNES